MKITNFNYKCFEGRIIEIPSVGERFFMNVDLVEIGYKEAKIRGQIIVINNQSPIFNDYICQSVNINNVDFKFYDKEEISRLLEDRIKKIEEDFFNNSKK